jgi:glycosyltransferase involved in cell wall biosynthesis
MKIAFITNLCAHYNIGTFELLSRRYDVDYFFFSDGNEWYWPREHRLRVGEFHFENLDGFRIGTTRITPSLPVKLLRGNYDIYIKCVNGRFALPVTYFTARIRGKPFILWTGIWNRIETPAQRLIFPLTRHIYRHADAIVVYGQHVKQYLVSEGVPAARIFVAAHATDNSFYGQNIRAEEKEILRSSLDIKSEQRVVLYLGRLEESKGVEYLVRAFAGISRQDVVLLIAGNGSLQPELKKMAKEIGVEDRVRFVGYVPIETAPQYYSIAWTYVLPSITVKTGKEPWGLVVNEAFNQGVPVIATTAVGAAAGGLIQDGYNGFIVDEKCSLDITKAINKLILNPDLRQEMSRNAISSISDWNYERNVHGYQEAIEYVQSGRK